MNCAAAPRYLRTPVPHAGRAAARLARGTRPPASRLRRGRRWTRGSRMRPASGDLGRLPQWTRGTTGVCVVALQSRPASNAFACTCADIRTRLRPRDGRRRTRLRDAMPERRHVRRGRRGPRDRGSRCAGPPSPADGRRDGQKPAGRVVRAPGTEDRERVAARRKRRSPARAGLRRLARRT